MSTLVKFCGCTSWNDVTLAIETHADAFGMIFAPSPRQIAWEDAERIAARMPAAILPVGVFVDPSLETIARARALFPHLALQLSGNESPAFVAALDGTIIKAIHVSDDTSADALRAASDAYPDAIAMFDTKRSGRYGGTGETFAWERIAEIARERPTIVAGGLTPENVAACVTAVHPFAVDVRSGIETDGRKDAAKMRAFIRAVLESDAA